MRKYLLIVCFSFVAINAGAGEYFVKLTTTGQQQRNELLNVPQSLSKKSAPIDSLVVINRFIPVSRQRLYEDQFSDWLKFDGSSDSTLIELQRKGIIEYFEPVGVFAIQPFTSDSLIGEQWYLDKINIEQAWQVTKGNPGIIIGVIDTGIDYKHPDLKPNLWTNSSELNGRDGIDDDGNGFIDDSLGWDFTDAPRFPDGGDYSNPDNDPIDEYGSGHGTQIAGIISAVHNNGRGIRGVAPNLRVMNIRAGTAAGYLEEDDVANAVFYAMDNGAKIINMSFGDIALSRFLKDVIYYATQNNILIIASSGNSASPDPHYPSGLAETISVGSSTENDGLASFSNYGNSLDLVAPGVNIISTAIGGKYNTVDGTSFSAPIVAATAGLIWSANPEFSQQQIRNILKTSADDILIEGWDTFSAAGRINAGKALQVKTAGITELITPQIGSSVAADKLYLIGSIIHPDIQNAGVSFGIGMEPEEWILIASFPHSQVYRDTLGVIDLSMLPDTTLTIRLQSQLTNGNGEELRATILIDRTKPTVSKPQIIELYDGTHKSMLVSFETDDITRARLLLRQVGQTEFPIHVESEYETTNHRFKLDIQSFPGVWQFLIETENYSGLKTSLNNNGLNFSFSLESDFDYQYLYQVPWQIPAGFLMDKTTDFDHDGKTELVISRYNNEHGFGPLSIFEFENDHFEKRLETESTLIPRDAGDVNNNGFSDILLGYGKNAFILESRSQSTFPDQLIWQDTTHFWAACYADLDVDQRMEIVGYQGPDYILLEHQGNNQFTDIGHLTNPTEGANQFGAPNVELIDLDADSRPEIIFGDYDGDIIVHTSNSDNSFRLFATHDGIKLDATEMITSIADSSFGSRLFVGTHTSDNLDYEHEFDARRWSIQSLKYNEQSKSLLNLDTLNFYGYFNTKDFDSGIKGVQFNGKSYLLVSFYPNLYVFRLEQNNLIPVWHYYGARTNTVVVSDLDRNGSDEIYFNNGQSIVGFTMDDSPTLSAPFEFYVDKVDSSEILLKWNSVGNADRYDLYRGLTSTNLYKLVETTDTFYLDSELELNTKYYYAVKSVQENPSMVSSFSRIDSAITTMPPSLTGIEVLNQNQLVLIFDQIVQFDSRRPYQIRLTSTNEQAASALMLKNRNRMLVSFVNPFLEAKENSISLQNVFNLNKVNINQDHNSLNFVYEGMDSEPYLSEIKIVNRNLVELYFNEPMDTLSLLNLGNYKVNPRGNVESAKVIKNGVQLTINNDAMIGALGSASYLELQNIRNLNNIEVRATGKISLFKEVNDLEDLLIYPQPVKPQHQQVIFANLPGDVQIRIYSLDGKFVRELIYPVDRGGLKWNLLDENAQQVSSGVYIYELKYEDEKKYGKIAIVR